MPVCQVGWAVCIWVLGWFNTVKCGYRGGADMVANRKLSWVALLLAVGSVPVVNAATFVVNTTVDAVDSAPGNGSCATAAGQCSLRAAIQEANVLAGADVITLPAGTYRLDIGGQGEEAAARGDLDISSEIVINGAAANTTIVDGMKQDRVFQVHRAGVATLNKLAIRNGSANVDGLGGGLSNRGGTVTLNDCNVYRNIGSGFGGGLDNNSFGGQGDVSNSMARMTVNRCTISDNVVLGNGGGVSNNDGILVINDSTIRNNSGGQFASNVQGGGIYNSSALQLPGAGEMASMTVNRTLITGHSVLSDGGGIYHLMGNMTISNSTISDNEAKRNGGGIFIANTLTALSTNRIVHTTITDNSAHGNDTSEPPKGFGGGGLFNGNPSNPNGAVVTYLENSLIAGNMIGGNCYNIGVLEKQGNFIDGTSCNNAGDTSGRSYSATEIGLGLLKDNGGPTQTHGLLPGSLAINTAVTALCKPVDQRGYTRPASGCDAGAFEVEGVVPSTPLVPTPSSSGVSTDGQNRVPQAFPMPYVAVAGEALNGVLNGVDFDGDPLTYEIVTQPTKGTIGLRNTSATANNVIPGSFTYVAGSGATGSDSFTYRVCDVISCSEPALISIVISNGAAVSDIGITLASGTGTASPITVLTGPSLDVFAPTADYNYPLGAFYFNVAVNAGVTAGSVTVTLKLPAAASIAANAVIRKLDNKGVWRTLGSVPNSLESTGVIDRSAKTITLVLRDNDRFDTDPAVGRISDPVAIAVPKVAAEESIAARPASGGGAVALFGLAALMLVAVRRRRH